MANWIQKNMGMITMIAAVLSALILTLPMLGVNLPTREGRNYHISGIASRAGPNGMMVGSETVWFDANTRIIIPGDNTPTPEELNGLNVQVIGQETSAWGITAMVVVQAP